MPVNEVLSGASTAIGLAVMAWAVARWVFGPRFRMWIATQLQPIHDELADNAGRHDKTLHALGEHEERQAERWAQHQVLHNELAAEVGTMRGSLNTHLDEARRQ